MCDVKMSLMCNCVVNRKCRSESESRQEEEGDTRVDLGFSVSEWDGVCQGHVMLNYGK